MDDKITSAVQGSVSIAKALRALGRAPVGTNYKWLHKQVSRLSLDTSHWKGKAHGTATRPTRLLPEVVLAKNSGFSQTRVRKVILRENLLPYVCAEGGCPPVWRGQPLVLRLDHKNGDREDHRLGNLRFLCPNCDSQTTTFCGRNKKRCQQSRISET